MVCKMSVRPRLPLIEGGGKKLCFLPEGETFFTEKLRYGWCQFLPP